MDRFKNDDLIGGWSEELKKVESKLCENLSVPAIINTLKKPENMSRFESIKTILARLYACTPQSADVDRLIKANNLSKTAFRSKLSIDTENKILYIQFDMPPLEKWDPRKAVLLWLNDKSRRRHLNLVEKDTVQKRKGLKGIFEQASGVIDSDDDDEYNKIESWKNVDKILHFQY